MIKTLFCGMKFTISSRLLKFRRATSVSGQSFLLFLFAGIVCARAGDRVISADWNQVKGPTTQLFHECIGAGRANEGLRADWQRQLQLCQLPRRRPGRLRHGLGQIAPGILRRRQCAA